MNIFHIKTNVFCDFLHFSIHFPFGRHFSIHFPLVLLLVFLLVLLLVLLLVAFYTALLLLLRGRCVGKMWAFSLEFFAKVYCFKQGLKIFHIKRNGFSLLLILLTKRDQIDSGYLEALAGWMSACLPAFSPAVAFSKNCSENAFFSKSNL